MGSIRAKTSSGLLTRFGDRHRVCGSLRRDGHGIATICKRAKRAISYGRSKRLHLSNRHARTNAACSRHIDDCRHAIAVSYVTAAGRWGGTQGERRRWSLRRGALQRSDLAFNHFAQMRIQPGQLPSARERMGAGQACGTGGGGENRSAIQRPLHSAVDDQCAADNLQREKPTIFQ